MKENEMVGACSMCEREDKCMQRFGLVGKPEGKRALERTRHKWEYNINMDLKEIGC
jgi:hypothetical protein